VVVFIDVVSVDPALPTFYDENSLALAALNFVSKDVGVYTEFSTKGNVCLNILINFIHLDMCHGLLHTQNPLG